MPVTQSVKQHPGAADLLSESAADDVHRLVTALADGSNPMLGRPAAHAAP